MADIVRLDIRSGVDRISMDSLHPRPYCAPQSSICPGRVAQYVTHRGTLGFRLPLQQLLREVAPLLRSVRGGGEHRRHLHCMLGALAPAAEEQSARRFFPVREQHRLGVDRNSVHGSTPALDFGNARI